MEVELTRDNSTLMAAIRRAFPIIGDKTFVLATLDVRKKINVIGQESWSSEGLQTMSQNKRSAIYIIPKVQYARRHAVRLWIAGKKLPRIELA